MKKLTLFAGIFFLITSSASAFEWDELRKPTGYVPIGQTGIQFRSMLDFPFTFHHSFASSARKQNQSSLRFTNNSTAVYSGFKAMRYTFPEQSYFCRMENEACKRYGFMFSIHAGGYRER